MRKYNLALKGMIDNYRLRLAEDDIKTDRYSDEQLYKVIDACAGMSTAEEQYEAVKDDVIAANEANNF
jgi:hypothetical protein